MDESYCYDKGIQQIIVVFCFETISLCKNTISSCHKASPLPSPSPIIMHKHFREPPSPFWDYIICERSLCENRSYIVATIVRKGKLQSWGKVSRQLFPREIATQLGLGLVLGLGAISLRVNCPRIMRKHANITRCFFSAFIFLNLNQIK